MEANEPLRAAVGLGSNLGDPVAAIQAAEVLLRNGGVLSARLSSFYLTQAEDCVPGTPDFVNAVLVGEWCGNPSELLALCQAIERRLGRPVTHSSRESRIIDLDILLLGSRQIRTGRLTVPHPRLLQRAFVLVPLAEVAPDWTVPPTGERVASALRRLLPRPSDPGPVRLPDPGLG